MPQKWRLPSIARSSISRKVALVFSCRPEPRFRTPLISPSIRIGRAVFAGWLGEPEAELACRFGFRWPLSATTAATSKKKWRQLRAEGSMLPVFTGLIETNELLRGRRFWSLRTSDALLHLTCRDAAFPDPEPEDRLGTGPRHSGCEYENCLGTVLDHRPLTSIGRSHKRARAQGRQSSLRTFRLWQTPPHCLPRAGPSPGAIRRRRWLRHSPSIAHALRLSRTSPPWIGRSRLNSAPTDRSFFVKSAMLTE